MSSTDDDVVGGTGLRDLLSEVADDLPGEMEATIDGTMTWSNGPRVFAILDDDALELRLDAAVAAAAIRTPDTDPSPRGPEWVRFHPTEIDDHAIDRVEAWFAHAHRRAAS
jgi:hypothetical protein